MIYPQREGDSITSSNKTTTHRALLGRVSAGALACAFIVSVSAAPASAASVDGVEAAERVAAQVNTAAPDSAIPVLGNLSERSVKTTAGQSETTIPMQSAEGIEVVTSIGGKELHAEISLPSGLELGEGELTSDGTVVYPSNAATVGPTGAVAVQTLSGGETRVQTVIPTRDAQHEFGYGMDGFRATIDQVGNAAFVADGTEGAYIPIEPAWAVDANGAAVETYYEVRGDELFQIVVASSSTAYPVVADPTWGWRSAAWGLTLSRSETAGIKDYAAAAGLCATLAKKSPNFAVGCGVWASYALVQATTANKQSPLGCLHAVVAPLPGALIHTHC